MDYPYVIVVIGLSPEKDEDGEQERTVFIYCVADVSMNAAKAALVRELAREEPDLLFDIKHAWGFDITLDDMEMMSRSRRTLIVTVMGDPKDGKDITRKGRPFAMFVFDKTQRQARTTAIARFRKEHPELDFSNENCNVLDLPGVTISKLLTYKDLGPGRPRLN